jgi:hypothetical protein
MPSVLVELGFLTNSTEEDFLQTPDGKSKMSLSVYKAFKEFRDKAAAKAGAIAAEKPVVKEDKAPAKPNPTAAKTSTVVYKEVTTGVKFQVQILTSSKPLNKKSSEFKGLDKVDEYISGNVYKYLAGSTPNFQEAKDMQKILREMGYGDDEKMEEGDEEKMEEGADEEKAELQADLEEAYKVIKSLKSTINEVNLLNAKLLYTNKLFRSYDLTNEQKHKVVETLDRTQNVREVKLVFSTLAESMKIGGTAKKVKQQTKMNESFASKKVASTAPKTIIAESNSMAERFKKLANIK